MNAADLATADGVPLLRTLQKFGGASQERVAGNDLMPAVLARAAQARLPVYLYGGREEVLADIQEKALREFPGSGSRAPTDHRSEH
ncbi:MAG: WecB/TagA/CpsF family glycosyltransferase [Flavobacteriales bacterium]|nr:WecB/TagA/CpsF family glycosyltransferase [Flavobacteriales bacterium]